MDWMFRNFQSDDAQELFALIHELYKEDFSGNYITNDKIQKTIEKILANPFIGNILMIEEKTTHKIGGYCILINYWSNEYGGNLLHLDELYIRPEYRKQGIGRNLIQYLKDSKFNDLIGIQLEISLSNVSAREFYSKIGFKPTSNSILILDISE